MPQRIQEVMTPNPRVVKSTDSIMEAAKLMRDMSIGDVIVMDDGRPRGIITDRDITIRATAEGADPKLMQVGEICTSELVTLAPTDSVGEAVKMMREKAIRRLPVVEAGRPVGIVSLGDLAIQRDRDSVLADISIAPPNS